MQQRQSSMSGRAHRVSAWLMLSAMFAWQSLAWAQAQSITGDITLLPPDQAFEMDVVAAANGLRLNVRVADGYYLYRDRFAFESAIEGVDIAHPMMPEGELKDDPLFGQVVVYRGRQTVDLPINGGSNETTMAVRVTSQGCADVGVCFPPQTREFRVDWTPAAQTPVASDAARSAPSPLVALLQSSSASISGEAAFLPPEEAFRATVREDENAAVQVTFEIADGYYLYQSRLALEPAVAGTITVGTPQWPAAIDKEDPYLGRQQVYYDKLDVRYPVLAARVSEAEVVLHYQGCAEAGLCYPPQQQRFLLALQSVDATTGGFKVSDSGSSVALSETDRLARTVAEGSIWVLVVSFFVAGLLLAFTPCVLPMVPILSAIIAGDSRVADHPLRGFSLSSVYVLAMSLTYTGAGVVAGVFGRNLQATFQHPAILVAFALLFVALALAMLGVYQLQLPASWQSRLGELSQRRGGGQLGGVAAMGALSALIVGPCVAAPLAAALIVIGSTGDPMRGGIALFALSMGMGAPLIIFGTFGARLLPRAGQWMVTVKQLFGVMMLAVAIYLLSRLLPDAAVLVLWAGLAALTAVLAWRVARPIRGVWGGFAKALTVALGAYAVALAIGSFTGAHDPLRPFAAIAQAEHKPLKFHRVASIAELESMLAQAKSDGRRVMLDYYADWCVSCKEMERDTFSDSRVRTALSRTVLLQSDVTAYNDDDKALLARYGLYGPPAILFFDAAGREQRARRVIGFMDADGFHRLLSELAEAS